MTFYLKQKRPIFLCRYYEQGNPAYQQVLEMLKKLG